MRRINNVEKKKTCLLILVDALMVPPVLKDTNSEGM
jgi:hypothetical protein